MDERAFRRGIKVLIRGNCSMCLGAEPPAPRREGECCVDEGGLMREG